MVQEEKFQGCPRIREQLRCFGESNTENHGGDTENHREKRRKNNKWIIGRKERNSCAVGVSDTENHGGRHGEPLRFVVKIIVSKARLISFFCRRKAGINRLNEVNYAET